MFDPDEISSRRRNSKSGVAQRPKLFTAVQVNESINERKEDDLVAGQDKGNPILIIHDTFPRVANRIIEFWNSDQLGEYLNTVVFMDRIDRSGFPHQVMQAIIEISLLWEKNNGKLDETNPWLMDPHLDKAFKKDNIEGALRLKHTVASTLSGKDAAIIDAIDEGFIKK